MHNCSKIANFYDLHRWYDDSFWTQRQLRTKLIENHGTTLKSREIVINMELLSAKGSRYLPFSSLHRVYRSMSQTEQGLLHSVEWPWCVACNKHAWIEVGFKLCHVAVKSPLKLQVLIGAPYVNKSLNLNLHYRPCQVSKIEVLLLTYEAVYTCLYIGPMQGDTKQNYTSAYLFVGFRQDLLSSLEKPSFLTQYQEGDSVGRELVKHSCLPANRLIEW